MENEITDAVLTKRLHKVYWPTWLAAYYARHDPRKPGPMTDYVEERFRSSRRGYDVQRVRFFLAEIRSGKILEPIIVESRCYQYRCGSPISWGSPEVMDGHHRYVAAILGRVKTISVHFSGLLDHLRWLKGEINVCAD